MLQSYIKWWSEPPIHHLSFTARAAVHTGIWAAWLLLMQYVVLGLVALCRKTHVKKYPAAVAPPKLSALRMLFETALGYAGWTWGIGLVAAWIQPGAIDGWQWSYECPNVMLLGYYATAVLMAYDAYSYPLHKWMHENKTVFNLLHKKHHEQKAALDATTSGYMALTEGVVSGVIPIAISYGIGMATGNWWFTLAGIWNSQLTSILGHCAVELTMNDVRDFLVTSINPFALWYYLIPCHATPMKHADHHMYPRRNYSFYFTYWDDKNGSSYPSRPPCTLLVLVAHALYQAALFTAVSLFVTRPLPTLAVYVTAYLLVPVLAVSAVAEKLHLPEITRTLFGRLMDTYRSDNCITYAAAGTLGSLDAALASAPAAAAAAVPAPAPAGSDADQDAAAEADCTPAPHQKNPLPHIFAVHPAGIISRSAFCTFAARGWASPVSSLCKVRLAVGSQLFTMPIPLMREFLLASGCVPADRASMLHALREGTSLAVTPGGWKEGQFFGSYKLVLKGRGGFVELAQQSGALLVPVLCLGEQDVATAPAPGRLLWGYRFLQTYRPHPVKVVFGKAVFPQVGESTEQLHQRYVQALLALGKEHDVKLELV